MGTKELLGQAILTAQRGLPDKAREMFHLVLIAEPRNEHAWVWLASLATHDAEREECLRQVVAINPKHPNASVELQRLIEKRRVELSAQVAALNTTPVLPPIDPAAATAAGSSPAHRRSTLTASRKPIRPRNQRLILYVGGGGVIIALIAILIALVANRAAAPIIPTPTYTLTRTPTVPPTWTRTFTPSPTKCPPRVCTPTPTVTPTATSTFTLTPSRTATASRTPTSTKTETPTRTATATNTATATSTSTATSTPTVTSTRTQTPSPTATVTPTASRTPTVSRTPTASRTATRAP